MNFFCFSQFVILLQCFFFFEILCDKSHHSLVITIRDDKFGFTKPTKYSDPEYSMEGEFNAPEDGKTYHFCPTSDSQSQSSLYKEPKRILRPVELIKPNDVTTDVNQCENSSRPVLLKVKNPKQLKTKWNDDGVIELYHYAFMLCADGLLNEQMETVQMKPRYESLCTNIESLLGIEFFYNNNTKQTVAVGYKLLSVSANNNWMRFPIPFYKTVAPLEDPSFLKNLGAENSAKFLEKLLGNEAKKYLGSKIDENRIKHSISASNFAPGYHFLLPLWAIPSQVRPNLFPMWHVTVEKWNEVTKFSEKVAVSVGDLTVTAGITGTMQLFVPKQSETNISTSTFKKTGRSQEKTPLQEPILLDDGNVRIPNYAWKAFQYNDYGILVVINCNPFIPTEKICDIDVCETNGWKVSSSDFSKGEVYCCDMTDENIQKLEADFLSLTEKKAFVLTGDSMGDTLALVKNS